MRECHWREQTIASGSPWCSWSISVASLWTALDILSHPAWLLVLLYHDRIQLDCGGVGEGEGSFSFLSDTTFVFRMLVSVPYHPLTRVWTRDYPVCNLHSQASTRRPRSTSLTFFRVSQVQESRVYSQPLDNQLGNIQTFTVPSRTRCTPVHICTIMLTWITYLLVRAGHML